MRFDVSFSSNRPSAGRLKRVAEEGESAGPLSLGGKRGRAAGEAGTGAPGLGGAASEAASAGAGGASGVPWGVSGHAGSAASGAGAGSAFGAGAGASASGRTAGPAIPPPQTASYTRLSLLSRTVKDLRTVCQAWGLVVSGNKNELAHRILAHQRQAGGR